MCVCVQTVTLYLVKWCSLAYEDSTWELKADIDQSKIEEYERIVARTPSTKKVASILLQSAGPGLPALAGLLLNRRVCVCVGPPPAPSSCRFTAPLTALHRAKFLWSCAHTHPHTRPALLWPGQTTNSVFNAEQKQLTGGGASVHHCFLCLCLLRCCPFPCESRAKRAPLGRSDSIGFINYCFFQFLEQRTDMFHCEGVRLKHICGSQVLILAG